MKEKDLLKNITEVDGVTVVYTGIPEIVHNGYIYEHGKFVDLGYKSQEKVEMYDADGNRLYFNCPEERGAEIIEELAEQGIEAVIGPKAPMRDADGRIVPNTSECVGIYIVSPEKKFSRKK